MLINSCLLLGYAELDQDQDRQLQIQEYEAWWPCRLSRPEGV